jgi:hypothetical protein
MERETTCNFEDIYYNMDGQTEKITEQDNKKLLHGQTPKKSTISFYCSNIYNYLISWFFPSHIHSIYE